MNKQSVIFAVICLIITFILYSWTGSAAVNEDPAVEYSFPDKNGELPDSSGDGAANPASGPSQASLRGRPLLFVFKYSRTGSTWFASMMEQMRAGQGAEAYTHGRPYAFVQEAQRCVEDQPHLLRMYYEYASGDFVELKDGVCDDTTSEKIPELPDPDERRRRRRSALNSSLSSEASSETIDMLDVGALVQRHFEEEDEDFALLDFMLAQAERLERKRSVGVERRATLEKRGGNKKYKSKDSKSKNNHDDLSSTALAKHNAEKEQKKLDKLRAYASYCCIGGSGVGTYAPLIGITLGAPNVNHREYTEISPAYWDVIRKWGNNAGAPVKSAALIRTNYVKRAISNMIDSEQREVCGSVKIYAYMADCAAKLSTEVTIKKMDKLKNKIWISAAMARRTVQFSQWLAKRFGDKNTFVMSYERLQKNATEGLSALSAWAGVTMAPPPAGFEGSTIKRASDDLRTFLTNYDEIRETLSVSPCLLEQLNQVEPEELPPCNDIPEEWKPDWQEFPDYLTWTWDKE